MADAVLGLTFTETMSGPFSLGEVDPNAGAERGKKEKTNLTLHAAITINNLDAFITDPGHVGNLAAGVEFSPWGASLPGDNGKFNLFISGPEEKEKLMIYETRIARGGETYYLAGKKLIHHERGPEILSETTTLYTVLHGGNDDSAPIVGAGVLTLGVGELLAMATSMQVLNASSPFDTARGISKFLRFFLGELWETYLVS